MIRIRRVCTRVLYSLLAFFVLLVIVFFLVQKTPKTLDQKRMALVDVVGKNYVFRGNNPFAIDGKETNFSYEKLSLYINDILLKKGFDKIDDYYLVDVSLLDIDEYYEIAREKSFFQSNPDLGSLLSISTVSPELLLTPFTTNIIATKVTDDYNSWTTAFLNKIHNLLLEQKDKPIVVYIHCNSGRDRTGFIVASYRMLFKHMSLGQANQQNVTEVGRTSEGFYDHATKSYCLYVNRGLVANNKNCD